MECIRDSFSVACENLGTQSSHSSLLLTTTGVIKSTSEKSGIASVLPNEGTGY